MENNRFRLHVFLAVFLFIIVLGTIGFTLTEGWPIEDSVYFCIVTVATVGYGDLHPATPLGKVMAIALIVTGVGTFLGVVANFTELMLNKREQQVRLQKLNMIIGVFFSEFGTALLTRLAELDPNAEALRKSLKLTTEWSHRQLVNKMNSLKGHAFDIDLEKVNFDALRELLQEKGQLLLRLFENPYLLEHEAFTNLLRSVLHLKEELLSRTDMSALPDSDKAHLIGDMKRVYERLFDQWLAYMAHLNKFYPYLFSLAMRKNPFDQEASVIVRG